MGELIFSLVAVRFRAAFVFVFCAFGSGAAPCPSRLVVVARAARLPGRPPTAASRENNRCDRLGLRTSEMRGRLAPCRDDRVVVGHQSSGGGLGNRSQLDELLRLLRSTPTTCWWCHWWGGNDWWQP